MIAVVSQDAFDNKMTQRIQDFAMICHLSHQIHHLRSLMEQWFRELREQDVETKYVTAGCTPPGRIHSTNCNWCGHVYYPKPEQISGLYKFCNQILFTPASRNGDSGSLLIKLTQTELLDWSSLV